MKPRSSKLTDITRLAGKLVMVPSQSLGLFGAGLGGKEEPKPGIAPACTAAGRNLASQRPADKEHQGVDATRRARQMAPDWPRDAVPMPWACCPGQCAAPSLGQVGAPGQRGAAVLSGGGRAIALATGVNLNLEMNPKELGEGDVIGVQMG